MAERAHPHHPGFQRKLHFRLKRWWIIPWLHILRNPYRQAFIWRYRWVARHCLNSVVLDIPCGVGWGTSLLSGSRNRIGVDLSKGAISEAVKMYGDKATFLVGSMAKLPFPRCSFDIVACLEGIEHVDPSTAESFIAEAARVLHQGGYLFLTSPNNTTGVHSGNPFHAKEYTMEELRDLLQPVFKIENQFTKSFDTVDIMYVQAVKST